MKKNFILPILLLIIFSIAGFLTWIASWMKSSSPSVSEKNTSEEFKKKRASSFQGYPQNLQVYPQNLQFYLQNLQCLKRKVHVLHFPGRWIGLC